MKNWWVVANAARARVLEQTDEPGVYVHLHDLVHPASREKGITMGHDRPGHAAGIGHATGGTAYPPRTDVRERERDHFAQELAGLLNAGVASGACAGLVLVASNPFLGQLKGHLGTQALKAVLRSVPSDFTTVPDNELPGRLDPPHRPSGQRHTPGPSGPG